jgi:protein O-GlcNAc transferase
MRDLSQMFDQAADLHRRGNLAAAENMYSELLKAQSDHFDALQMFCFLRYQQGRFLEALSLMGAALKTTPHSPTALLNYAVVLDALRRREEAIAYYDQALAIKPDYVEALFNRGIALRDLKRPAEALASFDRVLAITPDDVDALNSRGNALRTLGRPAEAVASYDRALAIRQYDADALNNRGNALRDLNLTAEALASYERVLAIKPDQVEALNNRGSALRSLGHSAEALVSYDQALAIRPNDAGAHYNRGNALQDLKRHAEALASFDQALAIKPDYAEALNNRGNALQDLKRPAEALASFDQALAIKPDYPEALNNRGGTLQDLRRPVEALASYDQALAIKPDYAEALYNRGNALRDLNLAAEAVASYDQALAIKPGHIEALNNRGNALQDLNRHAEALASFEEALAIKPDYADALNNRGNALQDLKRHAEALASFEEALAVKPDYADALHNRGNALRDLNRIAEALASFEKALAIMPDHRYAFGGLADAALADCDWARTTMIAGELKCRIVRPDTIISPFTLLGYDSDPWLQLECAKRAVLDKMPAPVQPLRKETMRHHDKIRVAYLSADFRGHAVATLIAELFELHNRMRFEVLGISFGPDDHSGMRARLMRTFDQFHDVRSRNDLDVAKLLNDLQVDIAVDLNGHTEHSRLGILAHRPAPIQVSYLGYTGTTGAGFIDYVIADKTVLPFDHQPFYTEKIVHLPDCYQVNDSKRQTAARTPTRREAGLPEEGFVFCCFNNHYKITPPVFDVWMRLLGAVEGSVLWLTQKNDGGVERNLRREAVARGIDPARLIFAPRVKRYDEHLARHRLADLFVDTLPFNAHTTASDALWAGLPLLTCSGASFAGRVATSLLYAVGLPELATKDLAEYEALALRLATDAALLGGFRQRLAQNRAGCPLFDTDRFRRHIENAYTTMWELQRRGESPRSFSVEPVG